jgi:hypothetical protein
VAVIPSDALEKLIYQEALEGLLINVLLEHHSDNGHSHYVAHPDRGGLKPRPRINWHSIPSALLIDGQNLLGSARNRNESLTVAVQKIYRSVPIVREARLFFCTQSGTHQHADYYKEEINRLRAWGKIEIIDRVPKILQNKRGAHQKKTDIDPLMLPEIPYLIFKSWIQGLVVVTGDSDYEKALRMWAGIGEYKITGKRPLRIISTGGDIARELRALTNHSHVEFSELRHL